MNFRYRILLSTFALVVVCYLFSYEWGDATIEADHADSRNDIEFQPSRDIKLATEERWHASVKEQSATFAELDIGSYKQIELPSSMTADEAEYFLGGEASAAGRQDVWLWLKANPHSQNYKGIFSELLSAQPFELVPDLISLFPMMSDDLKVNLIITFSGMLHRTGNPQEGDDLRLMRASHREIIKFLEDQTYSNSKIVRYAYQALFCSAKSVENELQTKLFYRFLNLSIREIPAIYPSGRHQAGGYSYWARKVATYSLMLSHSQPKAVLAILTKFSNLRYLDRKEIAVVFLRSMKLYESDQILVMQGKRTDLSHCDQALTRESYELLSKKKLLLESWAKE